MHEKALKILEFHLINSSIYFDDQLYFDNILCFFFSDIFQRSRANFVWGKMTFN